MGKGSEWSTEDTVQLCRSWLETSEDPIRSTGQKENTLFNRIYRPWLENRSTEETEERTEVAITGRLKKLQPEVPKFDGNYAKLMRKERSRWNKTMHIDAAVKSYDERHKQPLGFMEAWKVLRDKPEWTSKQTATVITANMRKAGEEQAVDRPGGQKAAKAAHRSVQQGKNVLLDNARPSTLRCCITKWQR
ncbi:unnamed protein product [Phytophthora fragariaefolia]|uniref:Unnamed protein product n=1 Tax=Phytophthora fragariaefolia TaxID=1490495 RepID=A0A9W6U4F5_9STRA|nr:unnamed protein product [Phytophthora fragariaefolia]